MVYRFLCDVFHLQVMSLTKKIAKQVLQFVVVVKKKCCNCLQVASYFYQFPQFYSKIITSFATLSGTYWNLVWPMH